MKSKLSVVILTLLVCAMVLAGCGNQETIVPETSAPSASPSASTTPNASTTPSASPTPTATIPIGVTPEAGEPDPTLGSTTKDIAAKSDLVLRGKFTSVSKDIWNQIRDANDPEEGDEHYYIGEYQYTFEISETYKTPKGKTFKAGDKIVVNMAFEERLGKGAKTKKLSTYVEPKLNQDTVIFLTLDDKTVPKKDIYYPDVHPFLFEVKDNALFVRAYSDKIVKDWNTKMKLKEGAGVPIANLKKDLGVK